MVRHPTDYKWSSYRSYAGTEDAPAWLTCQELPMYFPAPKHLSSMLAFVDADDDEYEIMKGTFRQPVIVGGNQNNVLNACLKLPLEQSISEEIYSPQVSLQIVLKCVGHYFGIAEEDLLMFQGSKLNIPREISIFLAHRYTRLNVQDLASVYSICRTSMSSAIAHAQRKIENCIELQQKVVPIVALIRQE